MVVLDGGPPDPNKLLGSLDGGGPRGASFGLDVAWRKEANDQLQ